MFKCKYHKDILEYHLYQDLWPQFLPLAAGVGSKVNLELKKCVQITVFRILIRMILASWIRIQWENYQQKNA